ncbi:MAG: IS200/IS605 family transposase [Saprospiraceae bacterium]|jgi:putative transposase|nr:IS200/IS605 family transposase [Saprospiraceae bacterium]
MDNRKSSHTIHQLQVHLVWITKYRYHVLGGEVQLRCRELIKQTCNSLDIQIIKGVVSKDHIHLHISYPPKLSVSDIVKRLKGRSAKLLLSEYPELKRRYWGGHLWGIGYGSWSIGNITEEMLIKYLEHHKDHPNSDENFILE